jgi:sugar phosphate isomerase/epimerase
MPLSTFSRRTFLAYSSILPWALQVRAASSIPIGLELYSVRDELKKDPQGTVRAVAKMGYQGVEFYAPYFEWTESQTKEMRELLDDLGIKCFSTHNDSAFFSKENLPKARDYNLILGSKYVVMASSDPKPGMDGWKAIADSLNFAADQLESSGLKAGYHNHQREFTPVDNQRPMEILAKNTKTSVMLQLDVGTCLEAGANPVAWIRANPGRIRSLHLKEWSPEPGKGYKVLFGEGAGDWKNILTAAESTGGAEYYLIEQEGSRRVPIPEPGQQCRGGVGGEEMSDEVEQRDASEHDQRIRRLQPQAVEPGQGQECRPQRHEQERE